MSVYKDNYAMHSVSGKLADLLAYRLKAGQTILAKKPMFKTNMVVKDSQLAIRGRFKEGTIYAKGAMKDPIAKPIYAAKAPKGGSAYNAAMRDFFLAPKVTEILTDGYTGKVGDKIRIRAEDDVLVKSVYVVIDKADGSVLEQGAATQDPDGLHWWYTATQANAVLTGTKINATAKDMPANATTESKVMP